MARYDKYEPKSGGFRAALAAAWTTTSGPSSASDIGVLRAVGLNASGQVVRASDTVPCRGVIVLTRPMSAGDIVDVMTDGEVVELATTDVGGAPAAGTPYYAHTAAGAVAGNVFATAASNTYIGHTVEASRLVVRVAR